MGRVLEEYREYRGPQTDEDVFCITPHHAQRVHVLRVLHDIHLAAHTKVNTVEVMQGREKDLVVVCYGFLDRDIIANELDFV